jgi:transcriptional regulator with XRE-family HTH domain
VIEQPEKSLVEKYESTPAGAQGLAAANLAGQVVRLIHAALDASGLEQKDLAEMIGVTEGRVSQVVNSDGNLRIAALARYMRALGYELTISAKPVEPGLPDLPRPARRTTRQSESVSEDCGWSALLNEATTVYRGVWDTAPGPSIIDYRVDEGSLAGRWRDAFSGSLSLHFGPSDLEDEPGKRRRVRSVR